MKLKQLRVKRCLALFISLFTLTLYCYTPVAQAAGGLQIGGSGGAITLEPGMYPSLNSGTDSMKAEVQNALDRAGTISTTIFAVCIIISMMALLAAVVMYGTSGNNPMRRQKAMVGIIFCGVSLALFGGLGVYVGFLKNFF